MRRIQSIMDVLPAGGRAVRRFAVLRITETGALAFCLMVLATVGGASAQPVDVPPTWGGSFWDRPRLTGSWFGFRDELGKTVNYTWAIYYNFDQYLWSPKGEPDKGIGTFFPLRRLRRRRESRQVRLQRWPCRQG